MRFLRYPLLPGFLLLLLALFQPWLEQSMARHMGIELPLLFVLGWLGAATGGERLSSAIAPWNAAGVPALTFSLLCLSLWMVPAALDYAVLDPAIGTLKVASLVLAGLVTGASWKTAGSIVQAFFVFNWAWMTLVVGNLYRDTPQQLCSVYLADEQADAGLAMIVWACLGFAAWLTTVVRTEATKACH